jgi:hypothetical protein
LAPTIAASPKTPWTASSRSAGRGFFDAQVNEVHARIAAHQHRLQST